MSACLKDVRRETFCAATHATATDGGGITLDAEELETVIAPGGSIQHNEAFIAVPVG